MELRVNNPVLVEILVGAGAGLALGIASTLLSPVWVVAGLGLAAAALIVVRKPELGLLGYLVITSTILDDARIPHVSIGFGSLTATDLILGLLFVVAIIRLLTERDFKLARTPLDLPLLAFLGIALFSTLIAVQQSRVTLNQSLGQIRAIFSYATFFLVTNLVRSNAQLKSLVKGFFYLAIAVCFAMIAQYLLGTSVHILPGRVETLTVQDASYSGITRVLPPGQSLIFFGFICLVGIMLSERIQQGTIVRSIQAALIGLAIILTFNRNFWIGIVIALAGMVILIGYKGRKRLTAFLLVGLVLASLLVPVIYAGPGGKAASLVNAFTARFETLLSGNPLSEDSMQFRYIENAYAIPQIGHAPILGRGLGTTYRPFDNRLDWEEYDGRGYIHNGHLWIMLQTGLLGYAVFLFLSILVIVRGIRSWKSVVDPVLRGIYLAVPLAYLGIFIMAIINPVVVQLNWTPVFGMLFGVNEVILKLQQGETSMSAIEGNPVG